MNNYIEYKFKTENTVFSFFTDRGSIAEGSSAGSDVHFHKFYELFYVTKGNVTINQHTLGENTAALIPCEFMHNTVVHENSQRIAVSFTVGKDNFISFPDDEILILKNFEGGDAFKRFARYYYGTYTNKNELIIACLHEIIMLVKEYASADSDNHTTANLSDSDIYRNYIIENYFYSNFINGNLSELAQLLHLSCKQTQRIIKKTYGHSFKEHIIMLRMDYGKKLLAETDLPISEISEKSGYKATHNFYSIFKKLFNTTPTEYRLKSKK
ncbi:MAG: helix-turn-helix transcriptional regulator [Clostridia bacterium]|nr:helix-turn-helix transcriptional regulator [Clostridia bacterium]